MMAQHFVNRHGFTLIELLTIIVLLGIIAVAATAKWPGDMQEEAAIKEFKRAIRYAQHQAMTRSFVGGSTAWGISVSATTYTIGRRGGGENAGADFTNRALLAEGTIPISDPTAGDGLWFNGLGVPITADPAAPDYEQPLSAPANGLTYTIAGSEHLTVCLQTGYVMEGATCP